MTSALPAAPPAAVLQALFLVASALLLPLPLRQHLVVQALATRTALGRMQRLASAHAGLPGRGAECRHFVRCARLVMQAVVPGAGGGTELPSPQLQRCCWMLHVWVVLLVGFALPTALLAALEQHRQHREQQLQQLLMHGDERRAVAASTAAGAAATQQAAYPVGQLQRAQPAAGGGVRRRGARRLGRQQQPVATPGGSQISSVSHLYQAVRKVAAALLLAGQLGRWLLLLVPVGALVWAALELASCRW
jgi:hypothetical protein